MHSRKKFPQADARALVAGIAAILSCNAWADEPSPWYGGVTQSLTHDSNVYRLNNGLDPVGADHSRADTFSSTGLIGGLDQSIGRQHFFGSGNVQYNKYRDNGNLDNTSYGLNAGWGWTSIWDLSGGVNLSANQSLAQLSGNSSALIATTSRNLVKTEQVGVNLAWGGTGLLSVRSDYTHSRVRYSDVAQSNSDSSADSGSIGTYYNISPDLTAGVAVRLTRTVQPFVNPAAGIDSSSTSNGRNIDLLLNWRYTVQTGVNGRLSWTRQTNAGGAGQDFSGLTGAVSATYAPTAKLAFSLSYNRDAGTNGTFFNAPATTSPSTPTQQSTTVLVQNSQVADSLSLQATYAATAKINATAAYTYRNSRIAGTNGYDDKLKLASLGASWAIARAWQLGCNISHEQRDASSTPGIAYSANVVGCTASLTLR